MNRTIIPHVLPYRHETKVYHNLPNHWPPIPPSTPCCSIGYAGGIGPGNITSVFDAIEAANDTGLTTTADANNKHTNGDFRGIWIDMESSLRSETNGRDVFDLEKCFRVNTLKYQYVPVQDGRERHF